MESVYIETTVVSLLAASPSRDLATAGQQQTTREWWQLRRQAFQCVTSDQTLAEVGWPVWVGFANRLHPLGAHGRFNL